MSQTSVKTLTDEKLQEIEKLALKKLETTEIKPVELSETEIQEIEQTFQDVKDFRQLGEKITAPIDNIIEKTTKIIEWDPVMDVSNELAQINNQVQAVYKEIINDDGPVMKFLKSLPWIGQLAKLIDEKVDEARFNLKSISGKIEHIFSGFDQAYQSLNKSIEMQKEFLQWLEENISKVKAYKEYVTKKLEEFRQKLAQVTDETEKQKYQMFVKNVEYFLWNLEVLIWNLELARKRLLIRLDAAVKLALSMNSSRPIFKTLLSIAVLETSGQKALDASMKAINIMWETIDQMSSDLTDKAIESSKKAEELSSKPVLDPQKFVENVKKLKQHFETIETYRQQVAKEAEAEREAFKQATEELRKIKEIKVEDVNELQQQLTKTD